MNRVLPGTTGVESGRTGILRFAWPPKAHSAERCRRLATAAAREGAGARGRGSPHAGRGTGKGEGLGAPRAPVPADLLIVDSLIAVVSVALVAVVAHKYLAA